MNRCIRIKRYLHVSLRTKSIIIDVIACLFILLFLYTAANKIWKFHNFDWVLSTLPFIREFHTLIAYTVPAAEVITSFLLLLPLTRRDGLIGSFLLMLAFTTYLLFMVIYAKDLPCNCGGVISHLSWKQHIIFNLFFLALSLIAIKFDQDIVRARQANR